MKENSKRYNSLSNNLLITFLFCLFIGSALAQTTVCFSIESEAEEAANGAMDLGSSDLELGLENGLAQVSGLRYTNFSLPQNAVINNANIQFTADETSNTTANLLIKGEATTNAVAYSNSNFNVSNRNQTNAAVSWQPAQWTLAASGPAQTTPDVSAILTEIMAIPGFVNGNAISFIITGNGTRTAENAPIDLCVNYSICGQPIAF